MKKLMFLLPLLFLSIHSFAQDDIPENVKQTFESLYTQAEDTFWDFREGAYVANFQAKEGLTKVFIHPYGEWIETRIRMSLSGLPKNVRSFVDTYYQSADITFAGKVIRENEVLYRVESELSDAVVVKLLNKEGQLIEDRRIDFGAVELLIPDLRPLPVKKTKALPVKELY